MFIDPVCHYIMAVIARRLQLALQAVGGTSIADPSHLSWSKSCLEIKKLEIILILKSKNFDLKIQTRFLIFLAMSFYLKILLLLSPSPLYPDHDPHDPHIIGGHKVILSNLNPYQFLNLYFANILFLNVLNVFLHLVMQK